MVVSGKDLLNLKRRNLKIRLGRIGNGLGAAPHPKERQKAIREFGVCGGANLTLLSRVAKRAWSASVLSRFSLQAYVFSTGWLFLFLFGRDRVVWPKVKSGCKILFPSERLINIFLPWEIFFLDYINARYHDDESGRSISPRLSQYTFFFLMKRNSEME